MIGRERSYRAEAVVLRRRDLGEADRLLTVYSREHGKLHQIAKGARRPSSRKAGHLELFTHVLIQAARGRELDVITQVEAINPFPGLRGDLTRVGQASYLIELIDRFTVDAEPNETLFALLIRSLEYLDRGDDAHNITRAFEMRLLDQAGFRPELFRCVHCGEEIRPEAQFFSFEDGGVLCRSCGSSAAQARPISLAALKILRHVQRHPLSAYKTMRVRMAVQSELDELMEGFLSHILERRLNTPAFLRRIKQPGGGVEPEIAA
jgi:DNA repair protein RecO (recombination protein O)